MGLAVGGSTLCWWWAFMLALTLIALGLISGRGLEPFKPFLFYRPDHFVINSSSDLWIVEIGLPHVVRWLDPGADPVPRI